MTKQPVLYIVVPCYNEEEVLPRTSGLFLEEINERGTTVLVVTHNKEIVNSMKKRVLTMHNGVIISDEKEGEYYEA